MNEQKVTEELNDIKEQMQSISLVAHEATEARNERREKRLVGVIVLLIVLLVVTNGAWLWYEKFMETVTETTTTTETYTIDQDSQTGNNNFIGKDGSITNGAAENNNN